MKRESLFRSFQSPLLAGQLAIWAFLFVSSLMMALLLRFTAFHSDYLPIVAYLVNALALLLGGYITGKKIKQKSWYFSGFQGIIYVVLLLIIGFLAFDTMIQINPFLFVIFAFGLSAIGGIIGAHRK